MIEHTIQLNIIKELLFKKQCLFSELNSLHITNDHFSFHIKRLLQLGIVQKKDNLYSLSPSGLEIAGRIDLNNLSFVAQPKVGVAVCVLRNSNTGLEILVGERLHDPLKGKVGFFNEKVRLGESFINAAQRCLKQETGLEADFEYIGTIHIIRKNEGVIVVDIVVNYMKAINLKGNLEIETNVSRNFWINFGDLYTHPQIPQWLPEELDLIKAGKSFVAEKFIENME